MNSQFKGTAVALATPFDDKKNIDFNALERLVNHCLEGGVETLVVLGTTGESTSLSIEEKHAVLDFVIKVNNRRANLVAGFGGNNTKTVIASIQSYHFKGIDAILSVSPAYNRPSQEGIYQHFMAIEFASPCPIILYNVPGRTGSNMTAETTLRLAKASSKFIAVKEASGNLTQCMKIVQGKPKDFLVFSGDDNLTLPMLSLGMDGVISVVANAYPRMFSKMVRLGLQGDFATAQLLHYRLLKIINLLFAEGNPAGVKAVLEQLNICSQNLRSPLNPISERLLNKMRKEMVVIASSEKRI